MPKEARMTSSIVHDQPDQPDPPATRREPKPLITVQGVSVDKHKYAYATICRDCGDVTHLEANFTLGDLTGVGLEQAWLYARRHLGRHLAALAAEINEFNR
jgi:hypothetical protein